MTGWPLPPGLAQPMIAQRAVLVYQPAGDLATAYPRRRKVGDRGYAVVVVAR